MIEENYIFYLKISFEKLFIPSRITSKSITNAGNQYKPYNGG